MYIEISLSFFKKILSIMNKFCFNFWFKYESLMWREKYNISLGEKILQQTIYIINLIWEI